jgi:putative holliday junction resolvase
LSGANSSAALRGTVLGIDYGERRIGVAVGELSLRIAHPVSTLHAASDRERLEQLAPLMQEWQPVLVIVGLPVHMDDGEQSREHPLAARCRAFARKLSRRFSVEVRMVDERLTSYAADQELAAARVPAHQRRHVLDQVAAQTILETFFATHDQSS